MVTTKPFTGEKYNLRWNSYQNVLISYLGDHLLREEHVDVTFACEGKILKAHKLILSACSSYFRELFQTHTVVNPVILLNNVKFEHFKYLIDFIYIGEIKVVDSDLGDVLMLATNLKIRGLSNIQFKTLTDKIDEKQGQTSVAQQASQVKNNNSSVTNKSKDSSKEQTQINKVVNSNKQILKRNQRIRPKLTILKPKPTVNEVISEKNTESNSTSAIADDSSTNPQNSLALLNKIEEEHHESQIAKKRKFEELNNVKQKIPDPIDAISSISIKEELIELGETDLTNSNDSDDPQIEENFDNSKINAIQTEVKEPSSIKPVSAFMIFANEWRKKMAVEHPDESNRQISVRLSSMWKNLSDETKETFYEAAKKTFEEQKMKVIS